MSEPVKWVVRQGDCIELMRTLPDDYVDSIVTDPPYGLGFMGKQWDALPPGKEWAEGCFRVLKPGGHLLAFGGTRTYHRLAVAIEDAGFEIRDCLAWMYGQGFPKSLDVSKAIDKAAGAEREVLGVSPNWRESKRDREKDGSMEVRGENAGLLHGPPVTVEALQWQGWGTALKPAFEPIVLARKPLSEKTVAANVLEHGTGAVNVDACRIPTSDNLNGGTYSGGKRNPTPGDTRSSVAAGRYGEDGRLDPEDFVQPEGRWPANVVLDEEAAAVLDEQSGQQRDGVAVRTRAGGNTFGGDSPKPPMEDLGYGGAGGASRFFYCAKTSKRERNAGVEDKNAHPTVKPVALMRWLVRLVTPPGGRVLDTFAGSGTTGIAAVLEGFNFGGFELDPEYVEIARARIEHWLAEETATVSSEGGE